MGYKFRIEYKKGSSNRVADALSRKEEVSDVTQPATAQQQSVDTDVSASFAALSQPLPQLLEDLRSETASLSDLVALREAITTGTAPAHVTYFDGLIYFDRRILLSPNSEHKVILLHEHHSTPIAGHPGTERTFRSLAAGFYWPKIRRDVRQFVTACPVCQSTKYSTQKPAGLLQPLPIPSQVRDDVSMDFITGLPSSRGYSVVMVVVDRLSKYAHFAALPPRFDAIRVAQLFVNTIVRHHGFSKSILSDRDPVFLNATWEEMWRLSGTKLKFSTAYHPQTDGQTEVRNRGLEQYLGTFAADKPSKWSNLLPWAELALNCFHNESIGMSPFRALSGREPPHLASPAPSPVHSPAHSGRYYREGGTVEDIEE